MPRLFIELATNLPPVVDPAGQWIAYGVVVDDDRDGILDRRFGIDNIPVPATGERQHRPWMTDLHTGRTVSAYGQPYGYVGETYLTAGSLARRAMAKACGSALAETWRVEAGAPDWSTPSTHGHR